MEIMQERFEAWLDSQPDDRVIDLFNCQACLMTSYLRENTLHDKAICSWTHWAPDIRLWSTGECKELPAWAVKLIDPEARFCERLAYCVEFDPGNPWYIYNNRLTCAQLKETCAQLKERYNRLFNQPKQELPQLKTNKCEALILNQC